MTAIELTPAERKAHRSAAHHLNPVVMIGAEGLSAAIVEATDAALTAHGLIKIRALTGDRTARQQMLADLARQLNAAAVQHIGKLLVLWRPMPETPSPKPQKANATSGSRIVKLVSFGKTGGQRPAIKHVTVHGNQRITAGGQIKRAKKRAVSVKKKAQG